jgi:hypothetical protein
MKFPTPTRNTILFFLLTNVLAMATETPDYQVSAKDGDFEVRDYPALTIARTASGDGDFMRLFRYIEGANAADKKIPMTAPVLMQHTGEKTGMSFILPSALAAEGPAPAPENTAVALDTMPPTRLAVLRFSGGRNETNEQKHLALLRRWIEDRKFVTAGEPIFAYYDPPWIPGFMRRNEVMLTIVGTQP